MNILTFQLSFSPTTPKWTHAKVLGLLLFIQMVCFGLTVVCAYIGVYAGINTFAFMAAEVMYFYIYLFWEQFKMFSLFCNKCTFERQIISQFLEFFQMNEFIHHFSDDNHRYFEEIKKS